MALLDTQLSDTYTGHHTGCTAAVVPCDSLCSSALDSQRWCPHLASSAQLLIHGWTLGLAWYESVPRHTLLSISVYKRYFMFLVMYAAMLNPFEPVIFTIYCVSDTDSSSSH